MPETFDQLRREVLRAHQTQVRAVRVGVREDYVRLERAAVLEVYAARRTVSHLDPGHLRIRENLDAASLCRRSDGTGHGAHATADEAPGALMSVQAADDVMVFDVGGARGAGTRVRADHTPHAERRLDPLGLEEPVQDLRDAPPGQRPPVFFALRAVEGSLYVGIGWGRAHEEGTHAGGYAVRHDPVGFVGYDILLGELGYLLVRLRPVQGGHQDLSVGEGDEVLGIEWTHVVAVAIQVEVPYHLGQEEVADVGAGREFVARPDLLGHRRPADHLAPLQNQDAPSSLRQIGRRDEPVVPGADHDGVVPRSGRSYYPIRPLRHPTPSNTCIARRPRAAAPSPRCAGPGLGRRSRFRTSPPAASGRIASPEAGQCRRTCATLPGSCAAGTRRRRR